MGAREFEELGEQALQAIRFILGEFSKFLSRCLRQLRSSQNFYRSFDRTERIAYLVGKACRELAQGRQPIGAAKLVKRGLQLCIDLAQLLGGLLYLSTLPSLLIRQHARQPAQNEKHANLNVLGSTVDRVGPPREENVGSVETTCKGGGQQASSPPEPQG